jgi:predicted ATPase/DNA-binding CsgD family transcriptional regulator
MTPAALPQPLTSLIGRERDVAAVIAVLREDGARLITLTGAGGIGKTRLTIQVAAEVSDSYSDGVWFVSLAPVRDPDLVAPAIAQALGIRETADQPLLASLTTALGDRQILLVLDNFEQVVGAAPLLSDLLGNCPGLYVLVTSRIPLHLYGERVIAVPPLAVPDLGQIPSIDSLRAIAAVQLFVSRAQAAQSTFALTQNNAQAVADICIRLDGLPLAVELAAARIQVLSADALAARLERRLPLLVGGPRDVPARQQTLRATIAWSYDLLQPAEQLLVRRLSILKGSWTLEAAGALVVGADDAPDDVLESLTVLVEHSLIQRDELADDAVRFTMLETIREFGLERLTATAEVDEAHRRHLDHLLRVFAGSGLEWQGTITPAELRRGDAEVENLRVALDWALEHEPERSLRLAHSVSGYWFSRGAFREAYHHLAQTMNHATDVSDGLRAIALAEMGMHATTYGDVAVARRDIDAALHLYQRLGDEAGEATCLFLLGRNAGWSGDLREAVTLYEQAIPGLRRHYVGTLSIALGNLGNTLVELGDLDRAAAVLEDGLAHAAQPWTRGAILDVLGSLAVTRGDMAQAREAFLQCLLIQQDLQDPRYIAQILEGCALIAATDGSVAHATLLLGAVSRLRDAIGIAAKADTDNFGERALQAAKAHLSAADLDNAWSRGRTLSPAEAIEIALKGLGDEPAVSSAPLLPHGPLTPRELDVLRLLVEGKSDREIAADLFISHHTVMRHVSNILGKLGVESRTAAATYAMRHDLQ